MPTYDRNCRRLYTKYISQFKFSPINYVNWGFFSKFASNSILGEMTRDLNRIKLVLVEKKRTNKWLAEQLGKDPATVSKWCTNSSQPGLDTLFAIAKYLNVKVSDLLNEVYPERAI